MLATARIAGIMAAKRTHELIPLCHPLPLTQVTVEFDAVARSAGIRVEATAKVEAKTGVEMEALTAVAVACLTIYDMVQGGRPGDVDSPASAWSRRPAAAPAPFAASLMALLSVAEALGPRDSTGSTRSSPSACRSSEARGRVLAEDLAARLTQPPFDASAMDGYAVRAADVATLPATLRLIGESLARARLRRARSDRARPCASSPARRCRRAPTPS